MDAVVARKIEAKESWNGFDGFVGNDEQDIHFGSVFFSCEEDANFFHCGFAIEEIRDDFDDLV